MHGVRIDSPVHGEPMWPEIAASVRAALEDEVCSLAASSERLRELMTTWPGHLVCHLLVGNPNLPQKQAIVLAQWFPKAFLTNPVLPLWFIENPNWLPPKAAQLVFKRAQQEPDWPALAEQYAALVAHLERCAAKDTYPS